MTEGPVTVRTVLAFIIAPLPAPALYYLSAITLQRSGGEFGLANFGMVYLLGLPPAYIAALVVGVPLCLLSVRNQWKSIGWYLSGGAFAGLVVWLVISDLADLGFHLTTLASLFAVGIFCSAIFFAILETADDHEKQ